VNCCGPLCRTRDPIVAIDAPGVHDTGRHLTSPYNRAPERRCQALGSGATSGYVSRISGKAAARTPARTPCVVVLPRTPAPSSRQALDHMRLGHLRCTAIVPFLGIGVTIGGAGGRQVMRGLLHAQRLRVGCMVEGPDRRARQPERKEARLGRSQPTTAQAELSDLVPGPRARLVPCLGRRRRLGRLELIPRAVASQDRPLPART
jgi:hypothetical protein